MRLNTRRCAIGAVFAILIPFALGAAARPLRVVATTPDLADLARSVGGEAVDVTSLTKGPQDIHFIEPRPSFVSELHRADALVLIGMDLEIGWLPAVLRSARNDEVFSGPGYIDASVAIQPLEVPTARVDRSMGDVHVRGNPHYLTDPLNGLAVAALLRDRFSALRREDAARFQDGYAKLASRIVTALVGAQLAASGSPEEIAAKVRSDELADDPALGGWLGLARSAQVRRAVQDHRYWPYFADRFGLEVVDTLEPKPGIAPTTSHLQEVIARIRAEQIPVLLATPYFDPRHARFVAEQSGVRVVPMAHQVGSRPGADDYVSMIDYDVRQVFGS
jgi:zinc/manganese transport system substrate-binding protein